MCEGNGTDGGHMDPWGDISDELMLSALEATEQREEQEEGGQKAGYDYIYIRRGRRASKNGTDIEFPGHYKIGTTTHSDVKKRHTDGTLPVQSYPIAKWRVPADRAYQLETEVHAKLDHLRIDIDGGHGARRGLEWFTWRKVLVEDSTLWKDLDTQEQWFIGIIDGILLIRHERVPPPEPSGSSAKSPGGPRGAKRARTGGGKSAGAKGTTDLSPLTKTMLETWIPPTNSPPVDMRAALQRAVQNCQDLPKGSQGKASDSTARSSRIALNLAAAFKRYTEWDGRDIWQIRDDAALKRFLDASKPKECLIYGAGSDCGAGSGSQAILWTKHVANLVAETEGERVAVRMVIGGQEYVWHAEWEARAGTE